MVLQFLWPYFMRLYRSLVLHKFMSVLEALIWFLLEVDICLEICSEALGIAGIQHASCFWILSLLLLSDNYREPFGRGLLLEVGKQFELCPYKVGFLNLVCDGEPCPSLDESLDHGGVVTLTYECPESVFVLEWSLDEDRVGEVHLPQQIPVVISQERKLGESLLATVYLPWGVLFIAILLVVSHSQFWDVILIFSTNILSLSVDVPFLSINIPFWSITTPSNLNDKLTAGVYTWVVSEFIVHCFCLACCLLMSRKN